jgi:anti-repressor protein
MKKNDNAQQGDLFPELLPKKSEVKKTVSKKNQEKGLKLENQQLKDEIKSLRKELKSAKVKADAYDELMSSTSLFSTSVVAKSFGWSAVRLNAYLKEKKVQYFKSGIWMLYQKYAQCGYTGEQFYAYYTNKDGVDHVRAHTYWTMKGYEFIIKLLKEDNLIK